MPELPEVEIVKQSLKSVINHKKIRFEIIEILSKKIELEEVEFQIIQNLQKYT